jgi:hypothetical protein
LVGGLVAHLVAALGLSLEHAHCQPLSTAGRPPTASPAAAGVGLAPQLCDLTVPNAAPHGALRLRLSSPTPQGTLHGCVVLGTMSGTAGATTSAGAVSTEVVSAASAACVASVLRRLVALGLCASALDVDATSWRADEQWTLRLAVALRRRGASGAAPDASSRFTHGEEAEAILRAVEADSSLPLGAE